MNVDRCQHVPTAPGQGVCTCRDVIMTQEFWIGVQAQIIADLTAQLDRERGNTGAPRLVRFVSGTWSTEVVPKPDAGC